MKDIVIKNRVYFSLGVLGLVILGLAGAGQFPYLDQSPFGFSLPNYAAY